MSKKPETVSLPALVQELSELRSRVEWLDEDRRKANRQLAELEQRLASQERDLKTREQRIADLESQLSRASAQLARVIQADDIFKHFKEEMVSLVEQYDQRRILAGEELERLFRVQHEVTARELGDIRRELPAIERLRKDMELRQAEESRLSNLIGVLQTRISALDKRVEAWSSDLAFIGESGKQNQRYISDLQTDVLEINKRWEPLNTRLDNIGSSLNKVENGLRALQGTHEDVQRVLKEWADRVQSGEYERNKQMTIWEQKLEEHAGRLDQFSRDWVGIADQYNQAKMVLQTLSEFQRQLEQQQHETNEVVRVEANRMQTRWDNFLQENEQRWKTQSVDLDQRWSVAGRDQKRLLDRIEELDQALQVLEQDREMLLRMMAAQGDAIKQFPRIWLEEVEKARSQNPNRRRQPALIPVREE